VSDAPWSRAAPLPRAFFARGAAEVAVDLLGTILVHRDGGETLAARIVETEAYLAADAASHARFGRTARNSPMFGPPGHAYVFLVYGLHRLLNVVTGRDGVPEAVLIRAAEPLAGTSARLDGPGRLGAGLRIGLAQSGADLCGAPLTIVPGWPPSGVVAGPRIGVDYALDWRHAPLRFFDAGSSAVSRRGRTACAEVRSGAAAVLKLPETDERLVGLRAGGTADG
jgi:DNA-3-methyladenine glycosylase